MVPPTRSDTSCSRTCCSASATVVHVRQLTLTNFRNYEAVAATLLPGVTVFLGPNGQGKTNLVEAMCYPAVLGSHRTTVPHALIRYGTDSATIRLGLGHGERRLGLEIELNRALPNRAQLNGAPLKTRYLPRYLHAILFAPEDLALVRGEPSIRRRFLDDLLRQRTPRYVAVLADYDRVVRQRNSLLKAGRNRPANVLSTLDLWDERLVELGTDLIRARMALVDDLATPLLAGYTAVGDNGHEPTARYLCSLTDPDALERDDDLSPRHTAEPVTAPPTAIDFAAALARVRPRELERGLTLIGPHRDDLSFGLRNLPAKGYASHGESWTFALALRLASIEILRANSVLGDPVVMLDDVFAELDDRRRTRLAGVLSGYEQVIITAAVPADVPPVLEATVMTVQAGTLSTNSARTPDA